MIYGKNTWKQSIALTCCLTASSLFFSMACTAELSMTRDGFKKPTFISGFDRLAANPGEEVVVTGKNLSKDVSVVVDGEAVDMNLVDATNLSFLLPSSVPNGIIEVKFVKDEKTIAKFPIMNAQAVASLPVTPVPLINICDNYIIKVQDGSLARGSAKCGADLSPCTDDGQTRCMATDEVPGAFKADLAEKILVGFKVAGVSGTAPPRPLECRADGSTECVAVAAFPAADKSAFGAADIRSGISVAGTLGIMSGSPLGCAVDGETGCLANASFAAAAVTGAASKIIGGQTLAGVLGTASSGERPADCSVDGGTNCVAVANFPAVDKAAKLVAGNIKNGITIAGILGDYPSLLNPLTADTPASDLPAFASTTGGSTYEWFDSTGARLSGSIQANATAASGTSDTVLNAGLYRQLTVTGDADLAAANISSGITILGVAGSATLAPANCSNDGQTACVAVTNFPAIDKLTKLLAGNIRNGVVIGPTTGDYPSVTSPLVTDTATVDLIDSTFASQIKSATAFEYWDSTGTRYAAAGDADIIASNIVASASIFGQAGSVATDCAYGTQGACTADNACRWTSAACEIDPWNIRIGATLGGKAGALKINCRNRTMPAIFDLGLPYTAAVTGGSSTIAVTDHPFLNGDTVQVGATVYPSGLDYGIIYYVINAAANTLQLSLSNGGGAITPSDAGTFVTIYSRNDGTPNWWDTMDDHRDGASLPSALVVSGWSSQTDCSSSSDWQDLTADGTCDSAADDCLLKDRSSGLIWSESYPVTGVAAAATPVENWHKAIQRCDSLDFGGYSDWRLPTEKELLNAYEHGIREVGYTHSGFSADSTSNNPNFMADVYANGFWSASVISNDWGQGWAMNLINGSAYGMGKTADFLQVICVH